MATAVLTFVGSKVGGAVVGLVIKQALGVQVDGASIEAWSQQLVLGVFFGGGLVPQTLQQKLDGKFEEIDGQLAAINTKITNLQNDVDQFKWNVGQLFLKADEQTLWRQMLSIKNSSDAIDARISQLRSSTDTVANQQAQVRTLANSILNDGTVAGHIQDVSDALLGSTISAGNTKVRGLLEIWGEQALQEADLGIKGQPLADIYQLIQDKFTVALLVQAQCGRLIGNAMDALHQIQPSQPSAQQYYTGTFYPLLVKEVEGFRRIVEALAVNLLPMPLFSAGDFPVPTEIAGILALADAFAVQILSGRTSSQPLLAGALNLPGVNALSGFWGRLFIPGSHWISMRDGSEMRAQLVVTTRATQPATYRLSGTLRVQAVKYNPQIGATGSGMNRGYVLYVGGEARDMDSMLMAQFRPTEVVPSSLSGIVDVVLQDRAGVVLAKTVAEVTSLPTGVANQANVPFGFFASVFTGGMEIQPRR